MKPYLYTEVLYIEPTSRVNMKRVNHKYQLLG